MGLKRGYYMTKKCKKEFDFVYKDIEKTLQYIRDNDFQIKLYLRDEKYDDAIELEKNNLKYKIELIEYMRKGYVVEFD